MKIYIVGTGGVGGYFGGLMAKGGLDVTFVARGDNLRAIEKNGLLVKSVHGDFGINPAQVIGSIGAISNPDIVIFSVKTYATDEASVELGQVVTGKTIILTFQNGMDNDLRIKKNIPGVQVFPGAAFVIAARTAPGVIAQTGGLCKLIFGDREHAHNPDLAKIVQIMSAAGVNAVLSEDITGDIWKKFIYIVPFSGLTALFRSPIGVIRANQVQLGMYEAIVRECIAVAKQAGVKLPGTIFEDTMTLTRNTAPESKSSLLIDIERKRPTELSTLAGALVHLAHKLGVAVPVTENTYVKIKRMVTV